MHVIALLRTALAAAIADFRVAESAVIEAEANAAAWRGRRDASDVMMAFAAEKTASAACGLAWAVWQRIVEQANKIVVEAAGADVARAIHDPDDLRSEIVAWREARNGLVRDAAAALPSGN